MSLSNVPQRFWIVYQPLIGTGIGEAADSIWSLLHLYRLEVRCEFNGVQIVAKPGDTLSSIIKQYEVLP